MHASQFEANLTSIEAEKSVLGAILLDGLPAMDACTRLQPEHFHLDSHRVLFRECRRLLNENPVLDAVVLLKALRGRVDELGGAAYISSLSDSVYRRFDPSQRIETIIETWKLRRGRDVCADFRTRFESGSPSAETLADLQASVFDAIQESSEHDDPLVSTYSDDAFADLMSRSTAQDSLGVSYGMATLDAWTGGMQPGEVTVVGARSGVGKTSLMCQAVAANARKTLPVAVFSLESSRAVLLEGLWGVVAGVEARKIQKPYLLNLSEREALCQAKKVVDSWPLRIYDKAELDINQIVALARLNIRQFGAKLVCVDYAQSVESEGKDERIRVANVSRKLTKMAKTEKCPLLLTSQLRKVSIEQYAHPPTAADLRETDQMNNDAHVIVLLHRPYDSETCSISYDASLIIPKMRRGQTGALQATFNPRNLCFEPADCRRGMNVA